MSTLFRLRRHRDAVEGHVSKCAIGRQRRRRRTTHSKLPPPKTSASRNSPAADEAWNRERIPLAVTSHSHVREHRIVRAAVVMRERCALLVATLKTVKLGLWAAFRAIVKPAVATLGKYTFAD